MTAAWMVANCKNGVSSYEIHRAIGVTQKSAWFMLHRIRLAMQDEDGGKLQGHVEVDETFIGGKARFMHKDKRAKMTQPGMPKGGANKVIVGGILERETRKVRTQILENRESHTLHAMVKDNVEYGSYLIPMTATAIGDWTKSTSIKLSIMQSVTWTGRFTLTDWKTSGVW